MARYFIHLAYDGKKFNGWQIQDNTPFTIQQVLEEHFSNLLREKIEIVGCGRTDTGVHAINYYAHFDTLQPEFIDKPDKWLYKLNKVLPPEIAILRFLETKTDAHSRYDALSRTYEYRIHQKKNPFLKESSWYFPFQIDIHNMNEACSLLKNYTDFSCFSKSNTQVKTNRCEISFANWEKVNDQWIFTITADRFLRNMVRAIVGTLLELGENKISLEQFIYIVESKDRKKAGVSVPAHGLYLTQVKYPESLFINEKG